MVKVNHLAMAQEGNLWVVETVFAAQRYFLNQSHVYANSKAI